MNKICIKKGCNNIGKYKRTINGLYCMKHYRFSLMRHAAQHTQQFIPTGEECEILLYIWCFNFHCPVCDVKLKWHSDINGTSNVISLQHNHDRTIMFICQGCNVGHGKSKLGDQYFQIPLDKKYCPKCKQILHKHKFNKDIIARSGLQGNCRECCLLYHKERKLICQN